MRYGNLCDKIDLGLSIPFHGVTKFCIGSDAK